MADNLVNFLKRNKIVKSSKSFQEAYPVKLKEVHIINVSPLIDTVINWVKPFLKEKIRNRIHVHPDGLESLYKFVPREILPTEYGGDAGSLQEIHGKPPLPPSIVCIAKLMLVVFFCRKMDKNFG